MSRDCSSGRVGLFRWLLPPMLWALACAQSPAAPQVISGSETCPNCGHRNVDWNRYRNEAYNCALGSYNSPHCMSAKNVLVNSQYAGGSNKGVRVRICSGMTGYNYGCQNVDVYWDFTFPPLSTNAIFPVVEDIIIDFDWRELLPPFTILKGLAIRLVSPDGERHDVYYPDAELEDGHLTERDLPTYPPDLPYPAGHPYAPPSCPEGLAVADLLRLDGTVEHRGRAPHVALGRTRAGDGRPITQDQLELVPDGLLIYHAGEHERNERYAPAPAIAFAPQRVRARPGSSRGWAVLAMGESGGARSVTVFARDGAAVEALEEALRQAVTTEFPDRRRHEHTVYVAYQLDDTGVLTQRGAGIVTLPMCCDPPPCAPGYACDPP